MQGAVEGVDPFVLEKVPVYDGEDHPSDRNAQGDILTE